MARTDTLGNFLTDVADAIRTKKGTTDTIVASEFDTEIASIESGVDINEYFSNTIGAGASTSYGIYSGWLFSISKFLEPLTVEGTSAKYMFYSFPLETTPELTDTSNVTDMSSMFANSNYLKNPNLKNFNTSNVTNMSSMFQSSAKIEQLDLSNFNTSNVTNMGWMFQSCRVLKYLDIRNFDFTKVTTYSSMFGSVPTDCEIIVKDDTAKEWITSKFTTLTNVKTVAELEASA